MQIYFYSSVCLVTGPLLWLILDSGSGQVDDAVEPAERCFVKPCVISEFITQHSHLAGGTLYSCGVSDFYATYSYSNYQVQFGLSAVVGDSLRFGFGCAPWGRSLQALWGPFPSGAVVGVLLAVVAIVIRTDRDATSAPWAM